MHAYYFRSAILLTAVLGLSSCMQTKEDSPMTPQAPKSVQKPHVHEAHGHQRNDPYHWMRDRENPEVIAHLEAENAYTESMLKDTEGFQEKLFEEMTGRIKQTDMSVPYKSNGYFYYTQFQEGSEYPVYCRKENDLDQAEEILLEVNKLAEGKSYFQVGGLSVSPNNTLMAYSEDEVGRRLYTLRFKNLKDGSYFPEQITNTSGSVAWANDNKTVFYTTKDETLRTNKVYRHALGTDPSTDVLVFEETDETFYCFAYRSKSGAYIMIGSSSTLTSEFNYLSADNPEGDFLPVIPRQKGHEYKAAHYKDHFYVITNRDAKNFRLVRFPIGQPEAENWEELIAHRPNVMVEDLELFSNYMVLEEREKGLVNLRVINSTTGDEHYLDFGESTYTAYVSINREFDTDILRYGYTSMTTPNSTFDYNMETKAKELLKQQEVVGDFDANNYHAERLFATASDGTQVPISLVYRAGINRDKNNPLLLYGYGSYGASMDPYFSLARLSLLDRGFVFAIAHIRGGEDLGRPWYEDGKLLNKKNTFTDFVACAEFLMQEGFTKPEKCFAMGGSAGGLLIGAVANMRPDLFNAMVAQVPFVDVVTTMLDETIPLTTGEYDEWGNPNDKTYYDYMLSYSPYDNVKEADYPAMLVTSGLHDSQVQYWEPTKWVARLRDLKSGDDPILLHTNMEAGHSGTTGRLKQYKEVALEYAFILNRVGITE